eukprot:scaffold3532_cov182-Ochromonas_danica.AAC.1
MEEDEFFECQPGPEELATSKETLSNDLTVVHNEISEQQSSIPTTHSSAETIQTTTTTTEKKKEEQEGEEEEEVNQLAEDLEKTVVEVEPSRLEVEKDITKALAYKEEGNELFRLKNYDDATQAYSYAIDHCPSDDIHKETLATFHGNRSAAYFAMEDYELVVDDCTRALELKADYVKVLARRMQAYEKLNKIEEALADGKKIQELDPSYPKIASTVLRLQRLYDEKMEKMKAEAMDKLKQLGNSVLGCFGMSLDNFKMNQDPSTGSWSI